MLMVPSVASGMCQRRATDQQGDEYGGEGDQ